MKKIYFVRHGQTDGNLNHYFQDDTTPLTELGHGQAEVIGKRLSHLQLGALVSGPMERTQQTSAHISKYTNLPIETFKDFHECQQPLKVRGKSKIEGEGLDYQQNYLKFYVEEEVFSEGFENFSTVIGRVKSCSEFLKNHNSNSIVVVSHAAFIRTLAAFFLLQEKVNVNVNVPLSFSFQEMSNAGVSEFVYDNDKWELVTWNDKAHFAE